MPHLRNCGWKEKLFVQTFLQTTIKGVEFLKCEKYDDREEKLCTFTADLCTDFTPSYRTSHSNINFKYKLDL